MRKHFVKCVIVKTCLLAFVTIIFYTSTHTVIKAAENSNTYIASEQDANMATYDIAKFRATYDVASFAAAENGIATTPSSDLCDVLSDSKKIHTYNSSTAEYQRYYENPSAGAVTDYILETYEDVVAYIEYEYHNYSDVTITSVQSKNNMGTHNYSQRECNEYYKKVENITVDNTCSEVAATILAEYYNRKGYGGSLGHTSHKPIFWRLLYRARSIGAHTNKDGTKTSMIDDIVTYYYDFYGYSLKGYNNSSNYEDVLENYNNNLKPVIGHFSKSTNEMGHSMTIVGYYDFIVKYKKNPKIDWYTTVKKRYYVVNDGLQYYDTSTGNYRIQYINDFYLDSITYIK